LNASVGDCALPTGTSVIVGGFCSGTGLVDVFVVFVLVATFVGELTAGEFGHAKANNAQAIAKIVKMIFELFLNFIVFLEKSFPKNLIVDLSKYNKIKSKK